MMRRRKLFSLLSESKYLISLIVILIVGVWVAPNYITYKDNFWNLAGLSAAIIGLFYTVDDRRNKRFIATFDNISAAISRVQLEIASEVEKKDNLHDKQITKLSNEMSILAAKIEAHKTEFGHEGITQEVFKIKDSMSDLNAHVVLLSQQGRMQRQVEILKESVARIEKQITELN